jgi:dTDP-4-dehydrorhamnose reductase
MNYDGIGLFNWFMKSKGKINGYVNSIWTGITTTELAKAVEEAIINDISGIYHLASGRSISKYELLLLLKDVFKKEDVFINKYQNELSDKSLINTRNDFAYKVPDYEFMVSEMREWMLRHLSFYTYYNV